MNSLSKKVGFLVFASVLSLHVGKDVATEVDLSDPSLLVCTDCISRCIITNIWQRVCSCGEVKNSNSHFSGAKIQTLSLSR